MPDGDPSPPDRDGTDPDDPYPGDSYPDDAALAEIEEAALALARLAGERIAETLEHEIVVEYKDEARGDGTPTNPVSEVDHAIEALLRERLAERFPDHGIIGEEVAEASGADCDFVWVVDPVDGTTNFINGFPLFASSIGVLHRGRPVAGAIWCSTGHALRPGVYHARRGGALRFEGEPVPAGRPSVGVSRRLVAVPGGAPGRLKALDTRVTGSAALECAFVAAGIFQSTIFGAPGIWDVAAGVCLVRAAGHSALTKGREGWQPLERFDPPASVREEGEPTMRDWRQPLILAVEEEAERLRRSVRGPSWWVRLKRRGRRRR